MDNEKKQDERLSAFELFDSMSKGNQSLKTCIEGILFISENPVSVSSISLALNCTKEEAENNIDILKKEYIDDCRGFIIRKIGEGYRMYSNPALVDILKNFVNTNIRHHITQAALETLAITAYKQPVTRTQVAEIRGVRTDSVIISLVNKGLLKEAGRLKEPGNPILYRTTSKFLEIIGLSNLDELPKLNII